MSERAKKTIEKNRTIFAISLAAACILYISFGYFSVWNPDSLVRSFVTKDVVWVSQARWGCQLWEQIFRSMYVLPELSLLWAILFLAAIPIAIIRTFEIYGIGMQALTIISVMASLHQASTMTYAYLRDEFTLAYLLAVLTASFFLKAIRCQDKNVRYDIYGICCMVLSLAIYQAYLSITLSLLFVGFILYTVSDIKTQECVKSFLRIVIDLIAGVILYYGSVRLSLVIWNTEMSSYRNMDQSWFNIKSLPAMIKSAYTSFFNYFFTNQLFFNGFRGKNYINIIIFLLILCILFYLAYKNKKHMMPLKYVLIIAAVMTVPLMFNVVFLMTNTGISFMMLPGLQNVYVIFIILVMEIQRNNMFRAKSYIMVIPLVMVLYTNVIQIFLLVDTLRVQNNKAVSIANNLDYAIKANSEYERNMRVLIVGNYKKGNYPDIWFWDEYYESVLAGTVTDFGQFWMGDGKENTTMNCWHHIFMSYCGTPYFNCPQEEATKIVQSSEFAEMTIFPEDGSIKKIDDVLVVKLSNDLY